MESNIRKLVELNRRYGLENRCKHIRRAMRLLRRGLLSDGVAKAHVLRVQPFIDSFTDFPNMLSRPPEHADIYPDGPPPLVIGDIVEEPDVPFGVFPRGPFFFLFEGSTGSGKPDVNVGPVSIFHNSRPRSSSTIRYECRSSMSLSTAALPLELTPKKT